MASLEIPLVPSIGSYRFGTAIDTVPYLFDVRWNTRDQAWYLDVLETDETPIVRGVKIVLGAYLGRRSNHPLFKNGVLVASDTSGATRDATFDDLGTRVKLQYIPVLDLMQRQQDYFGSRGA
jgi:hypothetical protein